MSETSDPSRVLNDLSATSGLSPALNDLADRLLAGDVRAAGRVCRMVDDQSHGHLPLLKKLFPHTGKAWVVGITGNPGAGKSTLVDRLIDVHRSEQKKVAVVAIDPTSPFSGGAILGDRIRMQRHFHDEGVFIRSVATRGALGGLSRSARNIVRVLDAWGADVILVETVGVGQDELEVTRTAHTTLVVMAPGMGDDIQAIKAGILECADVFAVNKADREGADSTVRDLELMIALGGETVLGGTHSSGHAAGALDGARERVLHTKGKWIVPIQKCVSTKNQGVLELATKMAAHRQWLEQTTLGQQRQDERLLADLRHTLRDALSEAALSELRSTIEDVALAIRRREIDPYTACENLIQAFRER